PHALISGLTKLAIAGRMPRRWSSELEHGSSHPSLARRLHAIRRAAPIPVMPFDDTLVVATTRPTSLVVLDRDGVWWVEAREPPAAVGRFTAMALGFVVVFVEGLLSLGLITGLVAIIRPSRAALAAVAGVAGACLLVFAGDLGVRSPTWPTLAYAAAAGLVC